MRSRFDQQLQELNSKLIEMGALCEESIALAAKALLGGDGELASRVVPLSREINNMEREIESLCLKLLLQQQPVAGDLRLISAALRMITDMERIGDQAEDIAEMAPFMAGREDRELGRIGEMARAAIAMVTDSVTAFVDRDTSLAAEVIGRDDVVDGYFARIKQSLIEALVSKPQEGEYVLDVLMVAKYLERIGDHATNIASWVVYSVTGVHGEEKA